MKEVLSFLLSKVKILSRSSLSQSGQALLTIKGAEDFFRRSFENYFSQISAKFWQVYLIGLKILAPSLNSKLDSPLLPLIHWSSVQVNNFTHNLNKVSWWITKTFLCISSQKSRNYAKHEKRNTLGPISMQ